MSRSLTRKEFLALTVAAGAALAADACGDDTAGGGGAGASGPSSGTPTSSGASPTTATNATSGTGTATATSSTGGGNACQADAVAAISCNHVPPHELTVPAADVAAGVDKSYDIQGQANHSHMVTITAADFATLRGGGTVFKFVDSSIQDHCVTVSCATPGDPEASGQCDGGNAFTCN